jgi:hypothetical protein
MSKADTSAGKVPDINLAGLKERMLLEAELITRDNELRNFSSTRDRLAAFGKNSNMSPRREREGLNGKLAARWNILRLDRRAPYPV